MKWGWATSLPCILRIVRIMLLFQHPRPYCKRMWDVSQYQYPFESCRHPAPRQGPRTITYTTATLLTYRGFPNMDSDPFRFGDNPHRKEGTA